jgi:type IV secretion system protein VirD4
LVVGPTQSRKTSGLAIPAILEWQGPVIAASVKGDLARTTLDHRSRLGRTWVYDPTSASGLPTSKWTPLSSAITWPGARRIAASLTEVARNGSGSLTDGDFWYSTAAKLIAPLLHAAALGGGDMSDVCRWLDTQQTDEVERILFEAGATAALQAVGATWNRDERQRSAIYTTAETTVEMFSDPLVAESSRVPPGSEPGPDKIDPDALISGNNTLYVCSPAHEQRRLRPLFTTIVTQMIEAAYDRSLRLGCPLDPPLLVVLDEAANVAPLSELDVLASTAAGHGIQLITVWQDLAQLQARYGARSGSVVNNHRAKLFLSGIADTDTLDQASRLIGDTDRLVRSRTTDRSGATSTTDSQAVSRLMPADALRRIPPGEGVLVFGHLPPVRIRLRPWYDEPQLRCIANGTTGK